MFFCFINICQTTFQISVSNTLLYYSNVLIRFNNLYQILILTFKSLNLNDVYYLFAILNSYFEGNRTCDKYGRVRLLSLFFLFQNFPISKLIRFLLNSSIIKPYNEISILWTCGRGDSSTPSFGSHLNPIPTGGRQIMPTIY